MKTNEDYNLVENENLEKALKAKRYYVSVFMLFIFSTILLVQVMANDTLQVDISSEENLSLNATTIN